MRNLYLGCKGDDVLALQQDLKKLGYFNGKPDGIFGNVTDASVRSFQRANGIYADGIIGPKSASLMEGLLTNAGYHVITGEHVVPKVYGSDVARYGDLRFVVSADVIRSFQKLTISASSELNDKENSNQGYASYKGSNPTEVTFTVHLNAETGCNVRDEAMYFVRSASNGTRDYFYVGGKKVIDALLLMTNATISDVVISPSRTWMSANVAVTLKQCEETDAYIENSDGAGGGSGGGGGGGGSYGGGGGTSLSKADPSAYSGFISKAKETISNASLSGSSSSSKTNTETYLVEHGFVKKVVSSFTSATSKLKNSVTAASAAKTRAYNVKK